MLKGARSGLTLLPRNGLARNIGILTGGTAAAQAVTVLALPLLTRLYTPADFGLLASYMALVSVASVIGCLRYNIAIPLPETDADGAALLMASLLASTAIGLLAALPVLAMPGQVAAVLGQPALAAMLWMVPVSIWAASLYNALQYWASRRKRFAQVARTRVERSVGGTAVQVGLGWAGTGAFGLLLGQTANNALGTLSLARAAWREDREPLRSIDVARLRRVAATYRRFPLFSVPETLFNTAGVQVPILIIAALAAPSDAGLLFLAMRVMGLPMGLVGTSVAQVYLAEAPARLRAGTLTAFTDRTMRALLKVGAAPLILVGIAAPFAFPILFGAEWARAGALVAWMTPWFVLQFVASPISVVLHVTNRLGAALALQLAGLALRLAAVLGAFVLTPDLVMEVYAVSGAVFYLLYLGVIRAGLR